MSRRQRLSLYRWLPVGVFAVALLVATSTGLGMLGIWLAMAVTFASELPNACVLDSGRRTLIATVRQHRADLLRGRFVRLGDLQAAVELVAPTAPEMQSALDDFVYARASGLVHLGGFLVALVLWGAAVIGLANLGYFAL